MSKVKYRTDFILKFVLRDSLYLQLFQIQINVKMASIRVEFASIPRKSTTSSSLLQEFRVVLCLSQSPILKVSGALSSGEKVAEHEADHSQTSSAKDSNHWSYTSNHSQGDLPVMQRLPWAAHDVSTQICGAVLVKHTVTARNFRHVYKGELQKSAYQLHRYLSACNNSINNEWISIKFDRQSNAQLTAVS